ncbi:hypothetical protein [Tenacibaculum maritimum]|uniref:hypothetical protein n=1 Tax=Tenacibaculum maritimum TaxID=107401 RepID=UPI0012E65999|nr:hypothetical protein [Tenacibaculum maritimum]CAA0250814.1 conserved hypothetical protein [Tenacibaculum maritimum]
MKKIRIFIISLFIITSGFSQQSIVKRFTSISKDIEISVVGLDDITIVNSDTTVIEVALFNQKLHSNYVRIENEENVLKIQFELPFEPSEEGVFRKFITKRLHKAYGIVKLPKNRDVILYGEDLDVISESYNGNLTIFIAKGELRLNTVKATLYQGNVLGDVNNTNIKITTNKGSINVNEEMKTSPYKLDVKKSNKIFKVKSIQGNIQINVK